LVPPGAVLSLAWAGLEPTDVTPQVAFRIARAQDWDGFVAALEDFTLPQQNIHYADVAGRIGFYAPGAVPIRRQGDGLQPAPGWDGSHDWVGRIPFEALPHALAPVDGRLLNANNRIVPADYPYLITNDWQAPYRARRIDEVLGDAPLDLAGNRALQQDIVSVQAGDMLPLMLEQLRRAHPLPPLAAELAAWDRVAEVDARAPLVFHAWYRTLAARLYGDELGPLFGDYVGPRVAFMRRALTGTARRDWCDDERTADVTETCAAAVAAAWEDGVADLTALFGPDPDGWSWGAAHRLVFSHPLFGRVPVLDRLTEVGFAAGGDDTTVDVGHVAYGGDEPYRAVYGPTFRLLADLSDPEKSRFVTSFGQSGHPLSRHYRDMTRLWATGDDLPMVTDPAAYRSDISRALRLMPPG
jgi:penicillin amidase